MPEPPERSPSTVESERQAPAGGVVINAEPARITAKAMPAPITIRTHLWLTWAGIAIRQEKLARAARAALEARTSAEGWDLASEIEPALIAIASATHAIDGFAGDVEPLAVPQELRDRWAGNRTPSRGAIMETLKLAFDIRRSATSWRSTLDWLADALRNPALHHRPEPRETVPHPTLPTNVGPEYANYTIENVDAAVTFMLEVFQTCIAAPKKGKPGVVEWTTNLRPSVEQLVQERANPRLAPSSCATPAANDLGPQLQPHRR
jgi:hypothetical protein